MNFRPARLLHPILLGWALVALSGSGPLAARLRGQTVPTEGIAAQSHTGQFVVRGPDYVRFTGRSANLQTNPVMVSLEPSLVTVSCERIKQLVARKLDLPNTSWQGKISIFLRPVETAADPATLTAMRFTEGWRYQLDLPEWLERGRYAQAVVQVVLLEWANRQAREHGAEIPWWLSQGLAEQLLAAHESEIILEPPKLNRRIAGTPAIFVDDHKKNPLQAMHDLLRAHPPLSFEELSWPRLDPPSGEALETYRASAHLFVNGLLTFDDGPASLRQMVAELPRYFNWQFAFLHAFETRFRRPLEVEKWWTLYSTHFTDREVTQAWSREQSWYKLEEALLPGVDIRAATNQLPTRSQVRLQTVVRDWEREPQIEALRARLRDLEQVQLHTAPELAGLTREYYATLAAFLERREQPAVSRILSRGLTPRQLIQATLRRLDELDARRELLRPAAVAKS